MSKEGDMKCPTEQVLYQDASQKEFMKKQLYDKLKAQEKTQRSETDPFPNVQQPITAGEVLDKRAEQGLDDVINCSQTMPTRPRPSQDEKLKQSDLDSLNKLIKQEGHSPGASAASSETSDRESSLVSENREKKSLFRRAKDRLWHAFHRQEREHKIKGKDGEKDSHKTDKLKKETSPKDHKVKKNKLTDSRKGSPNSIEDSRSDHLALGEINGRRQNSAGDSDSHDGKDKPEGMDNVPMHERTHEEREEMYGVIAQRLIRMADSYVAESGMSAFERGRDRGAQAASPLQADGGTVNLADLERQIVECLRRWGDRVNPRIAPHADKEVKQMKAEVDERFKQIVQHSLGNEVSLNLYQSSLFFITKCVVSAVGRFTQAHPHDKSPSPYPRSSSTDSHYRNTCICSSINSHLSTGSKNVLDDPGEDIKYMDEEDAQISKVIVVDNSHHKSVVNCEKDHPRLQPLSSLAEDWESDSHDGKDKPDGMDSFLVDNVPLHKRPCEEEEMYWVIAQRLFEVTDSYAAESGRSDSESHQDSVLLCSGGTDSLADLERQIVEECLMQCGDGGIDSLADLERQIVECLRRCGDRDNPMIDPHADREVEQVRTDVYECFKQIVQQSLGNEVSWNHLAFLFYTMRGVVSAVGHDKQAASTVKEMALRYLADVCAEFIMDQEGFDSVLSESDSDLE